ncbi:MAG: YdbH domain-containing protein [Kiloniellaceae bacterium]
MARRVAILLIAGLGLLSAALAGVFAFRAPLLEAVLKEGLRARGVPAADLTVRDIGLHGARLVGLRLGARGELGARSIRVAYSAAGLFAGRLDAVAVDGLSLTLDLTGAGPPLGSLQPLIAGGGRGAAPGIPPVTVSGGHVYATTPLGTVGASVEGAVRSGSGGALAASLAFDAEGEPGRARGTLDATGAPGGEISGTLIVEDGALALPGAQVRGLAGRVTFALRAGLPERVEAAFSLGEVAVPGAAFEDASLTLRASRSRLDLTADLRTADGTLTASARAALDDYLGRPDARIEAHAEVGAGAVLWPLLALPAPSRGRATLDLNAEGRLPPVRDLAGWQLADLAGPQEDRLTARLSVGLTDVSYQGRVEGLSGALEADGVLEGGAREVMLAADGRLEATRLAPKWLQSVGVPADLAALVKDGAALSTPAQGPTALRLRIASGEAGADLSLQGAVHLSARSGAGAEAVVDGSLSLDRRGALTALRFGHIRFTARDLPLTAAEIAKVEVTGTLGGTRDRLDGEADLVVDLAGLRLGGARTGAASLALPIAVRIGEDALSATLRAPGKVAVRALAFGRALASEAPLSAAITEAELRTRRGEAKRPSFEYVLTLAPDIVRVTYRGEDGESVGIEGQVERLRLTGAAAPSAGRWGRAEIVNARLALPAYKVTVEGVGATIVMDAENALVVSVDSGAIRDLDDPPRFAPVDLRGEVRRAGPTVQFAAEATDPAGVALLAVTGRHRTAGGQGEVQITLGPLAFSPGGLQPATLFPILGDLRAVAGTARAGARLAWAPGETVGEADLALDDLSFDSDAALVEGLSLDLHLDRLFPPRSPPRQRLSVRRIDPGVPLSDLSVLFQVRPGDPPRLAIATAETFLSGGRFLVRDVVVDPSSDRQDLTLEVEALDLAEVFRLLNVKGLSGEGRLSGAIPIAAAGGNVRIENGRLAATGPGLVRFRSAYAKQILAGAGESADLMLRALENFHYDELTLTIDKPPEAGARLRLVMLGSNPDVLDGHPFRFNINLEGDPGQLIAALREAYRLSDSMIRRLWMPGR